MPLSSLYYILIFSTIWLIICGSAFSVYIAIKPPDERNNIYAVIIGVTYTVAGGTGYSYVATMNYISQPTVGSLIFSLAAPWLAFLITIPIMLVGQVIKYRIIDYYEPFLIHLGETDADSQKAVAGANGSGVPSDTGNNQETEGAIYSGDEL